MVKAIGGGWYATQGGQKARGRVAAVDLETQEVMAAGVTESGRPTPRQLAITDSGDGPAHRGQPHSLVRGQIAGPGGDKALVPGVVCAREGCDYRRRRW